MSSDELHPKRPRSHFTLPAELAPRASGKGKYKAEAKNNDDPNKKTKTAGNTTIMDNAAKTNGRGAALEEGDIGVLVVDSSAKKTPAVKIKGLSRLSLIDSLVD